LGGKRVITKQAAEQRVWGAVLLALALGCSRANCNRSSRPKATALDAATAASVEPLTVQPASDDPKAPNWLKAMRERRWREAEKALSTSNVGLANQPRLRLAHAYVLEKTGQFGRAWALLQDLEKDVPELTVQVSRLRAESALRTSHASSGAEWFAGQGEPQAYVQAAKTYVELKDLDAALGAATRGIDLLTPLRDDASRSALAEARRVRAQVHQQRNTPALAAVDWLWLDTQAPTHPAARDADDLWEKATGQKLTVDQRLTRAVALAKAGQLEATEAELEHIQALPHSPLAPGYADWLLGKARSRGRVEHLQGARMLERSITAHVEDAESLRVEAARLYLRASAEHEALRVLELVAKGGGARSGEARALMARAYGILGDYSKALRTYDALLGKSKPKNKDDLAFEQAVTAILAGQPQRAIAVFDGIAQSERRESLRARAAELAAVAVLRTQNKPDAIARFRAVVAQFPFTLGAWLASERLKSLEVTPELAPVPASPAPPADAANVELPRSVATLHELGLVDLANAALTKEETALRHRFALGATEFLCKAYGALGTAERRYIWSRDGIGNLDLTRLPDQSTRWRWDCRFPQPYPGVVSELDQKWELPPGLVYAVVRQESNFREKIHSPAAAVGLTQVLPTTAEKLIREFGDVPQCGAMGDRKLEDPRCSLELGARYLHRLLQFFQGQLPLVIVSYNAGPEAVTRWLTAKKPAELDVFLAQVPFAETRNYVHHVITNFLVYSWLLGKPLPSLDLTPLEPSKAQTELY
jgi:soluble lytic murein transglycosylase